MDVGRQSPTELLTVARVAALLDATPRQVREWLAAGRLRGVRLVRQWRVPADELERVKEQGL